MNFKKLIWMQKDDRIRLTKASAEKLYQKYRHDLKEVYWTLIPIIGRDRTYVPTIMTELFAMTHGVLTYEMMLKQCSEDEHDVPLQRYDRVRIELSSFEEFINAIFSICSYTSFFEICGGNNLDFTTTYIDISSISVELYRNKEKLFSYIFDDSLEYVTINGKRKEFTIDDPPWDMESAEKVYNGYVDEWGMSVPSMNALSFLMLNRHGLFNQLGCFPPKLTRDTVMSIVSDSNEVMHAEILHLPGIFPVDNALVGVIHPAGMWITIMDADDYDTLLRCTNANLFLASMDDGDASTLEALKFEQMEPIVTTYDPDVQSPIGKGEWELSDAVWDYIHFKVWELDDIIAIITNIKTYLRIYHENLRRTLACNMIENNEDVDADGNSIFDGPEGYKKLENRIFEDLILTITIEDHEPQQRYICLRAGSYSKELPTLDDLIRYIRKAFPE